MHSRGSCYNQKSFQYLIKDGCHLLCQVLKRTWKTILEIINYELKHGINIDALFDKLEQKLKKHCHSKDFISINYASYHVK